MPDKSRKQLAGSNSLCGALGRVCARPALVFCVALLHLPSLAQCGKVPGLCDCLTAEAAASFGEPRRDPALDSRINTSSYGTGCDRHDLHTRRCASVPPECQNVYPPNPHCQAPKWCATEWCWVDPEACSLNSAPSEFFPGRTYSYATCGHIDFYKREATSLTKKIVNVGWKANTGGWKGVYHPTGKSYLRDMGYSGPVAELVKQAAEDNGWIINATGIPEEIERLCPYSSSFSCCVWAAGLGYLDICATEATVTALRSSLAEFYQTSDETSHLIVRAEVFWYETLLRPFRPFGPLSWLSIGAVILLALVGRAAPRLRVHCNGGNGGGGGAAGASPGGLGLPGCGIWSRAAQHLEKPAQQASATRWSRSCCGVRVSLLKSTPHFTVAMCGLQIFFELVFATYTANLFVHLVLTEEQPRVRSLDQVREEGLSICIQRIDAVSFRREYPDLKYANDPADGEVGILKRGDIFNYLDAKVCDVGITTRQDFEVMQGSGRQCDKLLVEEAVWKVPMGIAINPSKSGPISGALHQLREAGWWLEKLQELTPSAEACDDGGDDEDTSLALPDMAGLFAITGALMFAGYCVDLAHWRRQLRRAGRALGHGSGGECSEVPDVPDERDEESSSEEGTMRLESTKTTETTATSDGGWIDRHETTG